MYSHSQKQKVFCLSILLFFKTIFKNFKFSEKKDILSAPTVCIEILLIKIESEEGGIIKGCEFNSAIQEAFNLESMLNEAYADDLTVMFQWARSGLKRILEILNEFEAVSGLQINIKKRSL